MVCSVSDAADRGSVELCRNDPNQVKNSTFRHDSRIGMTIGKDQNALLPLKAILVERVHTHSNRGSQIGTSFRLDEGNALM